MNIRMTKLAALIFLCLGFALFILPHFIKEEEGILKDISKENLKVKLLELTEEQLEMLAIASQQMREILISILSKE